MENFLLKMTSRRFSLITQLVIFTFSILFFGMVAVWLGQDANGDLKNYHYYNGWAFFHHRMGWDIAPAHAQTYLNPLLDIINYSIIQYLPPKMAEFSIGAFHGLAVYFFLRIVILFFSKLQWFPFTASRMEKFNLQSLLFRIFCITLSTLIGVSGVASFSQLGTTSNESIVTAFVMASLFFAMKAILGKENRRKQFFLWILSAWILGLGFGLKMTAISYVVGFIFALLLYQIPNNSRDFCKVKIFSLLPLLNWEHIKIMVLATIFLGIGFIITNGFWMWFLYGKFHNPLFPFYNNFFQSPYAAIGSFADNLPRPKDFISVISYPFYDAQKNLVLQEGLPLLDRRYAVVIVLGVLCLCQLIFRKIFKRNASDISASQQDIVSFLVIFWSVSYISWLLQFGIYRYTIPLVFLSGIFIIYFCLELFRYKSLQLIACGLMTLFLMATTLQFNWGRVEYGERFIAVKPPTIPKKSIILLMGTGEFGYLAPFFPPDIRFMGFYNALIRPTGLLYQQVVDQITRSENSIYVITEKDFLLKANSILNQFGLTIAAPCLMIQSNLEHSPIGLCPVTHTESSIAKFEKGEITEFNPDVLWNLKSRINSENILQGSYAIEQSAGTKFVWVSSTAQIKLLRSPKDSILDIEGYIPYMFHRKVNKNLTSFNVKILINDHWIKTLTFNSQRSFDVKIHPQEFEKFIGNQQFFTLKVQANQEVIPAAMGWGQDQRKLSFIIGYIGQEKI